MKADDVSYPIQTKIQIQRQIQKQRQIQRHRQIKGEAETPMV